MEPVTERAPLNTVLRGRKHLTFLRGGAMIAEAPTMVLNPVTFASRTRVGAFTYLVGGRIDTCASIGRYCSIARDVNIGEPDHPVDWLGSGTFQYQPVWDWHPAAEGAVLRPATFVREPVIIGNDVWIGVGVTIRRGVTVGDGAIIAAGAVVSADVAPYTIVGGVPARPIRPRFDQALVADLLELRWWQYSPAQLAGLDFENPRTAVEQLRERIDAGLEPYVGETRVVEKRPDPTRAEPPAGPSVAPEVEAPEAAEPRRRGFFRR